jgi:hypothetical protein
MWLYHTCLGPALPNLHVLYMPNRNYILWLGWAYLTKTVRKPQRGLVNSDPPMIFCACSMQNAPAASEMPQGDFRTK